MDAKLTCLSPAPQANTIKSKRTKVAPLRVKTLKTRQGDDTAVCSGAGEERALGCFLSCFGQGFCKAQCDGQNACQCSEKDAVGGGGGLICVEKSG